MAASSPMTWQSLPVELMDIILEETELETQKACSLVCHAWLDVSRRYLFDDIVVRKTVSFDAFLQFVSTHPHIAIHIRNLHLVGPEEKYNSRNVPVIDPATLVDLATCTPNISVIKLVTVKLVSASRERKADLELPPGPIQLTELSVTGARIGVDHSPTAVSELLWLFEAEFVQVELCSGWAPPSLEDEGDNAPVTPRWRVRHQGICLQNIVKFLPSPLPALLTFLVPGCLRQLHLNFQQWSHVDEMGRFLRQVGESITDFTITFSHALSMFKVREHPPSEGEWDSYGFSALRNLSKLRFDLEEPLTCDYDDEPMTWLDSTGIPRFLACFPRDLPLHDGVDIDIQYVGDLIFGGTGYVKPRPEIEDALLRFQNLGRVGLCAPNSRPEAVAIGAEAFPRLWEAKKLLCMGEVEKCWRVPLIAVFVAVTSDMRPLVSRSC